MMKPSTLFFFIVTIIILGGCSGMEINSEYDNRINFSSYKSFSVCLDDLKIESEHLPQFNKTETKLMFQNAIESEMKSWYSINDSSPDLHAGIQIKIKDKKLTYKSCSRNDAFHSWPDCHFETINYAEGTLVIYVADVAKNQVIWQASLTGVVDEKLLTNKKTVEKTAHELFKQFPFSDK